MRKLILKMSMSLDGFVCDANGGNEWVFKTGDAESLAWSVEKAAEAGLIIMGRKTFEMTSAYWPTASGPFAAPMNTIPKATFTRKGYTGIAQAESHSPAVASWAAAKILTGDLAGEIRRLKSEHGKPIVAIGGAGFVQELIKTGLIDEYSFAIHPVALGSGLSIFTGLTAPLYLKLTDVKTFPGGTMVKTFHNVDAAN